MSLFQKIERWVEYLLWNSRRAMFLAVIACMIAFFAVLFMTVIDLFHVVTPVLRRLVGFEFAADAGQLHKQTLTRVVGLVGNFLVAIFVLLFSYGIYELFVKELDPARLRQSSDGDPAVAGLLAIRNLDDIKESLIKLVSVDLIVILFKNAVAIELQTPIEMLYFALGVVLVALAILFINLAASSWIHGKK
jgi:uncharacterized membrane protein YqhA